jgi:hypothetical protein
MRIVQWALVIILAVFVVAAIRGGVALLAICNATAIEWIGPNPSTVFALPAIVILAVGGTSLIALTALAMKSPGGSTALSVPGTLLAGYVLLDMLFLKTITPFPSPIGISYFLLGLFVMVLAVLFGRRPSASPQR